MDSTFSVYVVFAHFYSETEAGRSYPKKPIGVFMYEDDATIAADNFVSNPYGVPENWVLLNVAVANRPLALYPER